MKMSIVTKDDFGEYAKGRVSVLNYGDEFDPWYGCDSVEIKKEHLEALKNGQILYFDVSKEYCVIMRVEDDEETSS